MGIIGWRYGYVPPGESLSITELEFQEATREPRKECLLFLADETFRPADVDLAELTKIKAVSIIRPQGRLHSARINVLESIDRSIQYSFKHILKLDKAPDCHCRCLMIY